MKKRFVYMLLTLALVMTGCGRNVEEKDVVSDTQIVTQMTEAPGTTIGEEQEKAESEGSIVPEMSVMASMEAVTSTEETEGTKALATETPREAKESVVTLAPTEAPVVTPAPTAAPTDTPPPTEEPVVTPAPTAAPTDTPASTEEPVVTPAPTAAPTDTPVPTEAPVVTPVPTAAPTDTPPPTEAPVVTPAPTAAPTDTPAPTPEPTPEHTHTWDGGVVTTEATCGSDGVKTFTCGCGETRTEVISKTHQHDWETKEVLIPSTCATNGTQAAECRVCGHGSVTELPRTEDHDYVVTSQGCSLHETKYNCSVCGKANSVRENISCPDSNSDHICDLHGCWVNCVDSDGNQICDMCGCGI